MPLLLGWLLLLAACRSVEPAEQRTDLLDLFAYTESAAAGTDLDFSKPASIRPLVQAWSHPVRLESGETVVRVQERRATLRFEIGEIADRRLTLRCRRQRGDSRTSGEHLPVLPRLNQQWLEPVVPEEAFRDFVIHLPAAAQRQGSNLLELSHRGMPRRHHRRRALGDTVVYERLRIERLDGVLEGPLVADDALVLPEESRVDYFLRLPQQARLKFDLNGHPGSGLAVHAQPAEAPERLLWESSGAASADLDLADLSAGVWKLSFVSTGRGQLRVERPHLIGTAPAGVALPFVNPQPWNILLYVIDTLRADHLGVYGYKRPTSPRIDTFAGEATVFTQVTAQSSWTRPSVGSIMTGLNPYKHGALRLSDKLRPEAVTLAEILQRQGYATAGFVTNVNVSRTFGFDRGFERYVYLPESEQRPSMHVPADELHAALDPWLRGQGKQPFFLYVHATDPHTPYTPAAEAAQRFADPHLVGSLLGQALPLQRLIDDPSLFSAENLAHVVSLYDAEIAFVDEQFGRLLDTLKSLDLYQRTLIILTSDHGEEFYDHGGFEHGRTLYQEQLAVPLLVRRPGQRGSRSNRTAQHVDILPTVLATLGLVPPPSVDGRSLESEVSDGEREAYSQTSMRRDVELTALTTPGFKAIRRVSSRDERVEVYDLASDAAEKSDLSRERPVVAGYARQSLERWSLESESFATLSGENRTAQVDPATLERLRALGYGQSQP